MAFLWLPFLRSRVGCVRPHKLARGMYGLVRRAMTRTSELDDTRPSSLLRRIYLELTCQTKVGRPEPIAADDLIMKLCVSPDGLVKTGGLRSAGLHRLEQNSNNVRASDLTRLLIQFTNWKSKLSLFCKVIPQKSSRLVHFYFLWRLCFCESSVKELEL